MCLQCVRRFVASGLELLKATSTKQGKNPSLQRVNAKRGGSDFRGIDLWKLGALPPHPPSRIVFFFRPCSYEGMRHSQIMNDILKQVHMYVMRITTVNLLF